MSNAISKRIQSLSQRLKHHQVDAIIIPTADPHLSEYLPEHWQLRQWLSGFTGSAGTLVVTPDYAGLWADSRYWIQAEQQLAGTGIALQKLQKGNTHIHWLANTLPATACVVVDGHMVSVASYKSMRKAFASKQIQLQVNNNHSLMQNLWDELYQEAGEVRPPLPIAPLYPHLAQFVSQSTTNKLMHIRQKMDALGASHHLLSSLDDIAWLTNLRGADVDYNPVFLAHLLISKSTATLFIEQHKVSPDLQAQLSTAGIELDDYHNIHTALQQLSSLTPTLPRPNGKQLLIDPNRVAVNTIAYDDCPIELIENIAPSTLLKACKSPQDIEHIKTAMRQDGAALCQFFAEFENKLAAGERLSELDVDSMLIDARSQQPHYVSPSFPTIAGFNANGALPHYRATEDSFSYLDGNGLLLIDSGGQYQNGTTDITRVVPIGQISDAQRRDFTAVLKAHIALAQAHFPEGIASPLVDAICRAPLWALQLDYGHGTGHGVGYFLNVHEPPQAIAYSAPTPPERAMREGMVTSNEPGLYREGQWGIRIENLVVNTAVQQPAETQFGEYLYFETVTLCPIDSRLLDKSMMSDAEVDWLNTYHKKVFAELHPLVDGAALAWLTERTQVI